MNGEDHVGVPFAKGWKNGSTCPGMTMWPERRDSSGAVSDLVSLEGLGTMLSMPVFVHQECALDNISRTTDH